MTIILCLLIELPSFCWGGATFSNKLATC